MLADELKRLKAPLRRIGRNTPAHRALALKAARQATRVLPLFEREHPDDPRPRAAIAALRAWARGELELGMAEVRRLALAAHAAARVAQSPAATFAARAAGQAVATWHAPTHALAVPIYAKKATAAVKLQRSKVNKPRSKTKKSPLKKCLA